MYSYRYRIRGVKHLIMYALPHYAHFYTEVCNQLLESHVAAAGAAESDLCGGGDSSSSAAPGSVTVLYSAADALELRAVLGEARAEELVREARALSRGQLSTQPATHTFAVQ